MTTENTGQTIKSPGELAKRIAMLDPGSTAALRRGQGAGTAAFWRLRTQLDPDFPLSEKGIAVLIQAIAILTPKGKAAGEKSAHNKDIPMGRAMHSAKVSDLRLARLLAAKGQMRQDLVIRLCRRLARTEHSQFNLATLRNFLRKDAEWAAQQIAEEYYRAETSAQTTESTTDQPQETKND